MELLIPNNLTLMTYDVQDVYMSNRDGSSYEGEDITLAPFYTINLVEEVWAEYGTTSFTFSNDELTNDEAFETILDIIQPT
jgi:hypothetical protein